jgi:tetraacyldisaccharide 4'-kinase
MQFLRLLLFPFAVLYGIITYCRNKLYDWKILKITSFQTPIISVGNLEAGGSGKTPMIEYLINLLNVKYQLATLSRGYGRKTKGFRWVKPDDEAINTGDEPLQIKRKFNNIGVAVSEDRVFGIQQMEKNYNFILMDDAYQHRAVKPGLSILLFDYQSIHKPVMMLPAGNYREYFNGKTRADILIVSKCPVEIQHQEIKKIIDILKPKLSQKVFFTSIGYKQKLKSVFDDSFIRTEEIKEETQIILLTGIAKPQLLFNQIKKFTNHVIHHQYSDHHIFTPKNMLKLASNFEGLQGAQKIIITTEKDAVRLSTNEFKNILVNFPIYYWPIQVVFNQEDTINFEKQILEYAQSNQRIS